MKAAFKVLLGGAVLAASHAVVAGAAYFLGGVRGQYQLYARDADETLAKLGPILEDPAFGDIETYRGCDLAPSLGGAVSDRASLDRLRDELRFEFGDGDGRALAAGVEVKEVSRNGSGRDTE